MHKPEQKNGREASPDAAPGHIEVHTFEIRGLDCADCAAKLEKYVSEMPGVARAALNFSTAVLTVEHSTPVAEIGKAISGMGYTYKLQGNGSPKESFLRKYRKILSTAASGIGLAAGMAASFLGLPWYVPTLCFAFAIVTGGFYIFRSALYSLKSLTPDMNLLMTLAVAGAILINQWEEGAAVIFLFSVGSALQSYTLDRTRNSIKSLINLAPAEASVLVDGKERKVPVRSIVPGDILIIRPGERIAMDGTVVDGVSSVNQAPITGESIPVEKRKGSPVYAGTMNERGTLEVEVTTLFEENTLSKIIHMVEEAQSRKAPAQEFVDRFAKYYTPAVILVAAAIATIPPLFGMPFDTWFYRALVLLVIACPCALVISTPVSIVAAIGNASRHGVLIKGGTYLEECSRIKAIAFDKTGTLTEGRPEVTDVVTYGCSREEAIHLAASIEDRSEHPLAAAIMRANGNNGVLKAESFEAVPGAGITATVNGVRYSIGSARMFEKLGGEVQEAIAAFEAAGKTPVILGGPQGILAVFAIMDRVREESPAALKALHDARVPHLVMLTGDGEQAARAIARQTGVDEYYAGLLPEAKVSQITRLRQKYGHVAMVGDGVNDAPALAEASIGIAMGATGSDTAIETADIALMSNDLSKLSYLVKLGRRMMSVIKQNVTFSLVVKLLFIGLTLAGFSNLWMAVFADTGAAIIVILNGMRLLR
ncbi:putative Cd(2+)-translocating P-type ATPase [Methanocella arvoryzae MRE50]|uniref:Cd(2+)-translocating P-type ATPase n=2 Tax=Methanocella TaxID=570266 RepID=Q0W3Q5_METAR|nr:putative Cd(2+)-translocating P-type ATPase [Methanocella arvoryzae MRE50]